MNSKDSKSTTASSSAAQADNASVEEQERADVSGTDSPKGDLQQQLSAAQELVKEHWEKLVRAQAEVENIRKRSARDVEQARNYAIEQFVIEILAVKDSLELGLERANEGGNARPEKLQEGITLTLKLLNQIFERFEIEEVSPQGEKFDPEKHQAMMTQMDDASAPGTVLQVMQKGYLLKGRLVRPALVNVSGSN